MPPVTWAQAVLGGVACGALAWWVAGPADLGEGSFARFERAPAASQALDAASTLAARLQPVATLAIFPEPPPRDESEAAPAAAGGLRLHGTSISPRRRAALVSAGGAAARWLGFGQPDQGLELIALRPGLAVVRTSTGEQVTLELYPAEAGPATTAPESDPDASN